MSVDGQPSVRSEPFSPQETAVLLRAGSAAPSLYNSQPWRLEVSGAELRVAADPRRRSPVADPEGRQQLIACGAALLNVRLATRHLGFRPMVSLWPSPSEPERVATVRRGPPEEPRPLERKLYAQIHERHTNRERFGIRPINPAARQALRHAAALEGAALRPIDTVTERDLVIDLLVRAIRSQRRNNELGVEMARWLHTSAMSEGMPIAAWHGTGFPVPGLDERSGATGWERNIAQLVHVHTFFVLTGAEETPTGWLTAGQALQRVLLTATQLQLAVSFFNQILENPPLRSELVERLGLSGHPQMMFRAGYPVHRPQRTGRRPAENG